MHIRAAGRARAGAAVVLCLALAVGASGCRPEPVIKEPFIAPIASPSPSPTLTPTPTATPRATASPQIPGMAVIAHAQVLLSEAEYNDAWQQGLGAYRMTDGTIIALDHAQPLPDAVTADIQSLLNAIGVDDASTVDGTPRIEATQTLAYDAASTGKTVAMVRHSLVRGQLQWVSLTSQMGWRMQSSPDLGTLMAQLQARIAADEHAADWVIFTAPAG